ncbi:hypothetical protein N9X12_08045, partial [Alphaproteobacteria bacterium]|nr:hypothetical protein [Alphaproteobacteria bacterium]
AGEDVRNFEAGYVHNLDIGYSNVAPQNVGGQDNFTGWQFVDADGVVGGASFAFTKATWDGIGQPGATENAPTAIHSPEEEPDNSGFGSLEHLTITIYHNGGTFHHQGVLDGHQVSPGIAGHVVATLSAADLEHADFDAAGDTLTLYLVHRHGSGSIELVKTIADGDYRFAEVTITRGENNEFTVTSITRAAGEFVNGGQLKTIANEATVGVETYQLRPVDVNEAPDNLRIIAQTLNVNNQPISQIALDWIDPTTEINIGGDADANNDVLEGLKDGTIWTFDNMDAGTPLYFVAPVNGKLDLPDTGTDVGDDAVIIIYVAQGANPAVPDLPENGWSLRAMTKAAWDALSDEDKDNFYQLGTISAPDSTKANARSFTPVSEVASATPEASEGGEIILTAAHLRAVDEDGINTATKPDPANIVYIITGYQDADYHQSNAQNADDDQNVKMGWIEKLVGTIWVKLDVTANPDGTTPASFTQADVNAGLVRFVSSGADANSATNDNSNFTATFTYVVRDNLATEADRKLSPEQTATVTITNTNDAPLVDNVAGTDGNASRKSASEADRSFTENVPQTDVDITDNNNNKIGGITLTNAMFGIVDVDHADAQVQITMLASPTTDANATFAYVAADGQVTINGKAAGVLQVLDDNGVWTGQNIFTLAQLEDGHVRFVQDVRSEESNIKLFIHEIRDMGG